MQADGLVAPRNSHLGDAGPKESLTLGGPNTPALLATLPDCLHRTLRDKIFQVMWEDFELPFSSVQNFRL